MPRRVINNFSKGMITDSIGEEGAVAYLQDMYLRKKGELISRGPIYPNTLTTVDEPTGKYTCGYSTSEFHPNIGLAAVRGRHETWESTHDVRDATSHQLIGCGIQSMTRNDDPEDGMALSWGIITEGVERDEVCHDVAGTHVPMEACYQSISTGDEIVFAGENGYIYKWAGSYTPGYAAGTVSIASSPGTTDRTVTGSGTTWSTNIEAGMYILINNCGENSDTGEQRAHRIINVNGDTELTIENSVWLDSGNTGLSYRVQPVAVLQSPPSIWNSVDSKPRSVGVIEYHANRLYVAGVSDNKSVFNSVYEFDTIRFSGSPSEYIDDTGVVGQGTPGWHHMDLWHENGFIRIMPGVGGFIRGLYSMNGNLMVIKSHGLFSFSHTTSFNSNAAEADLRVESRTIGASGFRAWAGCQRGLVLANQFGLYLWDGDSLQSLTEGRIGNLWESFSEYATEYVVNVFGSLVVVGSSIHPDLPCVCWDFEKDYFFIGTNMSFSTTSTIYGADDMFIGHVGFAGHVLNMPRTLVDNDYVALVEQIPTSDLSSVMHWILGNPTTTMDAAGIAVGPKPIVATHPIPLSADDGPGDGRINNVGATLFADKRTVIVLRPGESGVDQIIYSEHQSDGTDFSDTATITRISSTRWGEFNWDEGYWGSSTDTGLTAHGGFSAEEIPLTSEIGEYSGGYKNVRIPIDSFPSAPFVSLVFTSSNNSYIDATSYQIRLQALFADYEPTSNWGTI